jgi:hypothetical protein
VLQTGSFGPSVLKPNVVANRFNYSAAQPQKADRLSDHIAPTATTAATSIPVKIALRGA